MSIHLLPLPKSQRECIFSTKLRPFFFLCCDLWMELCHYTPLHHSEIRIFQEICTCIVAIYGAFNLWFTRLKTICSSTLLYHTEMHHFKKNPTVLGNSSSFARLIRPRLCHYALSDLTEMHLFSSRLHIFLFLSSFTCSA